MKLYLVRHGETRSNVKKVVVSPNDQLTPKGISQAKILAKRFSKVSIETILSSPQSRCLKTAEIINNQLQKKITTIALLKERKWPSETEGRPIKDPAVESIFKLMREEGDRNSDWHYRDEESFLDLKNRAVLFLDYISGLVHQNILAVSHEYFIKVILSFMMHGDQLTYPVFRDFFYFTKLDNTSVTLCEKEKEKWRLIVLNDQSRLA